MAVSVENDLYEKDGAMKKILLLHSGRAHLPELSMYKKFFQEYSFTDCQDADAYSIKDFDLTWHFMGTDFRLSKDIPCVHEYASLSVGRAAKLKDMIKRHFNVQPSLRIFLNHAVQNQYSFRDRVPHCYRDMGIDENFFCVGTAKKAYDFVYVGNMGTGRSFHKVLEFFSKHPEIKLLLVGLPGNALYEEYKKYRNLIFAGTVPYQEVPALAGRAEYALNYIPDKYPYHVQTSTKLVEYVAMDLKVVTTSYYWVNHFEQSRKMTFYKISEDLHDLDMESLRRFPFTNTSVDDLRWENIFKNSGIKDALRILLG